MFYKKTLYYIIYYKYYKNIKSDSTSDGLNLGSNQT